jgi:hypothetical protein
MALAPTTPLRPAELARMTYDDTIEADISIDDVLDRRFWVHRSKQLVAGTLIQLATADNAWWAVLMVLDVKTTSTGVAIPTFVVLSYVEIAKAKKSPSADAAQYIAKFNGADKWVIIRNSDKEKVEKGIPTKEAAEAKLAELLAA